MRSRILAGAVAGLIVTWIGYLAFIWAGVPFLPALLSDLFFSILPGDLQAEGIATLGVLAKPLTLYSFMLLQVAGLAIGSAPRATTTSWLVHAFLIIAPMYLVLSLISTSPAAPIVLIAISVVGLIGLHWMLFSFIDSRLAPAELDEVVDGALEQKQYRRREFLTSLATAAGALLLWPVVSRQLTSSATRVEIPSDPVTLPPLSMDDIDGLPPALTPTPDFYYVSKNLLPHQGRANEPLVIDGLVENPLSITVEELIEMDAIEEYVTLMCVDYEPHNSMTNSLISNGLWKGVPLSKLLDLAGGPTPGLYLEMHATDGYSTAIPIEQAYEVPETMIAYMLNGQALNGRHGFPARLIAPGIYGFKNPKHINKISVTDQKYYGYWEGNGWAYEAPVKLMSRISTPLEGQRVALLEERWIAGIAYSGRHGISKVEVSTDDGYSWSQAGIETPLSQYSWVRWAFRWTPNHLGETSLLVRATDSRGELQDSRITRAFPAGATGYHRVRTHIVEG